MVVNLPCLPVPVIDGPALSRVSLESEIEESWRKAEKEGLYFRIFLYRDCSEKTYKSLKSIEKHSNF